MTHSFVLNERGPVATLQLTKETAVDHVKTYLSGLKTRFDKHGVVLKAIYMDNCSQVRQLSVISPPKIRLSLSTFTSHFIFAVRDSTLHFHKSLYFHMHE